MDIETVVRESRASQNKEELLFLLLEVARINPKVILEIGSWRGYSMEVWQRAFDPTWAMGIEKFRTEVEPELYDIYPFMIADSNLPETRDEIVKLLQEKQIDFLFIDGDHTYKAVKQDYELYAPLVKDGGIVAFHDIWLNEPKWVEAGVEVCKFWKELKEQGMETKEIIGKDGTGTGILYL